MPNKILDPDFSGSTSEWKRVDPEPAPVQSEPTPEPIAAAPAPENVPEPEDPVSPNELQDPEAPVAQEDPEDGVVVEDDVVEPPLEDQPIRDEVTYTRNRAKFEAGEVPTANLEEVFLAKVGIDSVTDAIVNEEIRLGTETFLNEVLTPGTPTNTLYRFVLDTYNDSYRMQELLERLSPEARAELSTSYKDPNNPKGELRRFIAKERVPVGNTLVDGTDAYEKFVAMDGVGRGRFLLYESGVGLELIVPQNSDFDTLFNMLARDEIAQYVDIGLEIYDLTVYRLRELTMTWLRQFITKCTMRSWQKPGFLERAITLTDFNVMLVYLANLCYPDGFDRFVDRCFRPIDKDHPAGCSYQKRITIAPGDLVVTRFALMTEEQLQYMADRKALTQNTLAQINEYKRGFGFGHQVIQHRDWTITFDMPTLDRYFAVGRASYAASESVIAAGNTPGVLFDMSNKGFRNVSTYISAITRTDGDKSLTGTDPATIMKLVGKICTDDERLCDPDDPEQWLVTKIQSFIDQCNLTYIGYKSEPCPQCGWINDKAAGWSGVDPLRVFFTIGRSLL